MRLSAFEHWLARGDARDLPGGWRGWLATAMLGVGLPGGEGGAGLAAGALLAAGPGRYFWFATPVHFVAGLDTLHLPVTGLLALSVHEQQSLVADFLRAFQGAPWRLHAIGFRDLLLEGPDPGEHTTHDPAVVVGGDLAAAQPHGAGVRPLRQLAAEIEMWLFEHPVSRERERRGELPLTGLWPWGGGAVRPASGTRGGALRLHADDAYSAALAATCGQTLHALPATARSLPAPAGDTVVVLSGACFAGWPDLQRLEAQWFAPLVAQLAAGRWSALTLVLGRRCHTLHPWHRWRGWRRPRAWWEEVGR